MALKDNIDHIKKNISSEEQFLENIIKSERFFKRNKKIIMVFALIAIVGISLYYVNKFIEQNRIDSANKAYSNLIINPQDQESIKILKDKDVNLYALYKFKRAVDTNNTAALKELSNLDIDPLFKSIIVFQSGDKSADIMQDYSTLMRGFELLKEDKIDEAKNELSKIPLNSPLNTIAKNLLHYNGTEK